MVPLAARKVVHSVGDDMGMEQRPGAGDVLVLHGLASGAELISCVGRAPASQSCSSRARVRFLFLSGTRSILRPPLNIRMYFIVLTKGTFFPIHNVHVFPHISPL